MKLELVKETKINGTILYSVEMDGKYVSNTATEDLEQAEGFFKSIIGGGTTETIKETIKTIEVDEN
jgi:hypothetical protein